MALICGGVLQSSAYRICSTNNIISLDMTDFRNVVNDVDAVFTLIFGTSLTPEIYGDVDR
jgi:hypothetical protein